MENNCNCELNLVTRKDLQVFRGTYAEVMKQPTVNMKVYLAWDTQQIFVGNNHGIKTPYNGQYKVVIQKYINDFSEELNKTLDGKIQAKVDEALKGIKEEVAASLKSEFTGTIQEIAENAVKDKTDALQHNIDSNRTAISKNASSISSQETKIENNKSSIDSLNNQVSEIHEKEKSMMIYKTGEEITQLAEDIANFKPVFCTHTSGNYTIGKIYYVDNGKIKAMAGGGSIQKQTIDAGFSLSVNPPYAYMGNGSVSCSITPSVSHPEAVASYIFDGKTENSLPDVKATLVSIMTPGIKTLAKLSGTPIESTDEIEYTAKEVSAIFNVYQPMMFGNDDALVKYLPGTKTFNATITPGQHVYLYAQDNGLTFQSGGFEVPIENIESNVPYSFDGATATYYKYDFGTVNDTTITINIK